MIKTSEVLEASANVFNHTRLLQGRLGNFKTDRPYALSTIGSILFVVDGITDDYHERWRLDLAAVKALQDDLNIKDIGVWNDQPLRTRTNVQTLLRRTADSLRKEEKS